MNNNEQKIMDLYGNEFQYNYFSRVETIIDNGIENLKIYDSNKITQKNKDRIQLLLEMCADELNKKELNKIVKMNIWSPCVFKKGVELEEYIACPFFKNEKSDPVLVLTLPFALYDRTTKTFFWLKGLSESIRFTTIGRNMEFFSCDAITNVMDFDQAVSYAATFRLGFLDGDISHQYKNSGTEGMKTFCFQYISKKINNGHDVILFFMNDIGFESDKSVINKFISSISFSDESDKFHKGYPFGCDENNNLYIIE